MLLGRFGEFGSLLLAGINSLRANMKLLFYLREAIKGDPLDFIYCRCWLVNSLMLE